MNYQEHLETRITELEALLKEKDQRIWWLEQNQARPRAATPRRPVNRYEQPARAALARLKAKK
jgi:hypothetical protein